MMANEITYQQENDTRIDEVIALYEQAGLPRPTQDPDRIATMYRNANLVVTARLDGRLVGISRALTDFSFCCYLSDLAVSPDYQKSGIGKKLVELTKEIAGEQVMLLLLSVPSAMEYYPRIGMKQIANAFWIPRTV